MKVWDTDFDLAILAGPRIKRWPSIGAWTLSSLCAKFGVKVGLFGGDSTRVRGVLPLQGTGAVVVVEDQQGRLHRIRTRAVVKWAPPPTLPPPFPGWDGEGLLPLETAEAFFEPSADTSEESRFWRQAIAARLGVAILGTGNRAMRFGSRLMEFGVHEVFLIESHLQWGAKRYAGWEVERRRLERLGGKVIEATPISLFRPPMSAPGSNHQWELKIRDQEGVRILDVFKVVSAGPFEEEVGYREYPENSLLFETYQTSLATEREGIEGWVWEENHAKLLAVKLIRALRQDLSIGVGAGRESHDPREMLERISRGAKGRLKVLRAHQEAPFTPEYEGKWLSSTTREFIAQSPGVPKETLGTKRVPSLECFECIPCGECVKACPEKAIEWKQPEAKGHSFQLSLNEGACTSCGLCLPACPSEAIVLLRDHPDRGVAEVEIKTAPEAFTRLRDGELVTILNRKRESLISGRVLGKENRLLKIEVPSHLIWESRGAKDQRPAIEEEMNWMSERTLGESGDRALVTVIVSGEKRIARAKAPVTQALFENGIYRTGDRLWCADGSCGLCTIEIDGQKRFACQERVHQGMAVELRGQTPPIEPSKEGDSLLCPCLGISEEDVRQRLQRGKLSTPEALLLSLPVGRGRCHGALCSSGLRRVMTSEGCEKAKGWVDWRFPWVDWKHWPPSR